MNYTFVSGVSVYCIVSRDPLKNDCWHGDCWHDGC